MNKFREAVAMLIIIVPPSGDTAYRMAQDVMARGAAFETPNGEITDALARRIATEWATPDLLDLSALGRGKRVARERLADDITAAGRRYGWPAELAYLATWLLNHD